MSDICDTRKRILKTAAEQYAEVGYEGMSLRSLTEAAGVNLAAVNYHFGSKKTLIVTLVRESITPMNDERMKRLDCITQRYGSTPPPIAEIVDSYLRPLFEMAGEEPEQQVRFLRMVGRVLTEPEDFWKLFEEGSSFCAVTTRFIEAIQRALPHLSHQQVEWRFFLMVSTLIGSFVQCRRVTNNCRCSLSQSDISEMLHNMSEFVTHGCRGGDDAADGSAAAAASAANTGAEQTQAGISAH